MVMAGILCLQCSAALYRPDGRPHSCADTMLVVDDPTGVALKFKRILCECPVCWPDRAGEVRR